jgi:5-formyltetrahydrofolate cyclo-ligase
MIKNELLKHRKKEIRKNILHLRDSLNENDIESKSVIIQKKLWHLIEERNLRSIMFYIAFGSEVRTQENINKALKADRTVIVPVCIISDDHPLDPQTSVLSRELLPSRIFDFQSELAKGTYGILEPKPEFRRPFPPEDIELVVVPGVAFDERLYRVGYGAGYYDRFLPKCKNAFSIALAYDIQIVENVFPASWDVPVDCIITETKIIKSGKGLIP